MSEAALARAPEGWSLSVTRRSDMCVSDLVRLMRNHEYKGPESIAALAKEYGLTEVTVRDRAHEAARILRLIQDPEEVRAWSVQHLRQIAEDDSTDDEGRPNVPASAKVQAIRVAVEATLPRDPGLGKAGYQASAQTRDQRIAYLRSCLVNPDDELLEAMRAERDAILSQLGEP